MSRVNDWDTEGTLREAGVTPEQYSQSVTHAMADRFLQIHQGDPKKAGKALREWLARRQA